MHSACFRRFARLFAVVLLFWTAADLLDYGVCAHHRERVGAWAATALRAPSPESQAGSGSPDDCFCCSHFVHFKVPFTIELQDTATWVLADLTVTQAHGSPALLYHPPLA